MFVKQCLMFKLANYFHWYCCHILSARVGMDFFRGKGLQWTVWQCMMIHNDFRNNNILRNNITLELTWCWWKTGLQYSSYHKSFTFWSIITKFFRWNGTLVAYKIPKSDIIWHYFDLDIPSYVRGDIFIDSPCTLASIRIRGLVVGNRTRESNIWYCSTFWLYVNCFVV